MSYFGLPRLCFFGTFRASPSTINNTDANFAEPPILQKLWNPKGGHEFQLLRGNEVTIPPSITVKPCTVQSVTTQSGTIIISQDAVWMQENLDGYPAGLNFSVQAYTNSLQRLKQMRDLEGAQLFMAHDGDQYKAKGDRWYK